MVEIVIDGDACPVKDEVYQVAARHGLRVLLVAYRMGHKLLVGQFRTIVIAPRQTVATNVKFTRHALGRQVAVGI